MTLRDEIKKKCFGLDDDELDTEIAYRDVLDVVGNIESLVAKAQTEARIDEVNNYPYWGASEWEIDKRLEELKKQK